MKKLLQLPRLHCSAKGQSILADKIYRKWTSLCSAFTLHCLTCK